MGQTNVVDAARALDVSHGTVYRHCSAKDALRDAATRRWLEQVERPDATYRTEYRTPDDTDWTPRYVFDDEPRSLCHFEATNDYLQSAPESPFTGTPTVVLSTKTGYRELSGDTLVEVSGGDRRKRTVTGAAWHDVRAQKFGLRYRAD